MIWLLAIIGILAIIFGLVSNSDLIRPARKEDAPDPSREEAWAILGQPVVRTEEPARRGEHGKRQFRQGLLLGVGSGLMLAAAMALIWPQGFAPVPPASGKGPSAASGKPAPAVGIAQAPGAAPGATGAQSAKTPAAAPGSTASPAPVPAAKPSSVTFVVDDGDMAPTIATKLKAAGLITDESQFLARASERGVDTLLKSGTYVIPTNAPLDAVIDALTA